MSHFPGMHIQSNTNGRDIRILYGMMVCVRMNYGARWVEHRRNSVRAHSPNPLIAFLASVAMSWTAGAAEPAPAETAPAVPDAAELWTDVLK